ISIMLPLIAIVGLSVRLATPENADPAAVVLQSEADEIGARHLVELLVAIGDYGHFAAASQDMIHESDRARHLVCGAARFPALASGRHIAQPQIVVFKLPLGIVENGLVRVE